MNAFHRGRARGGFRRGVFRAPGALLFISALALAQTALGQTESPAEQHSPAASAPAGAAKSPTESPASHIEILTDTGGIDLGPYLSRVAPSIRSHWIELVPDGSLVRKQSGRLTIEFSIQKNGQLGETKLISSSGEMLLDRAAMAGITSSAPFPPLPPEFSGRFIRLRFNFAYRSWLDVNSGSDSTVEAGPEVGRVTPLNAPESPHAFVPAILRDQSAESNAPKYPQRARDTRVEGTVILKVAVDTNGAVNAVTSVSGDPILADAAMHAVRKWRFYPAQQDSRPVEDYVQIRLEFRLDEKQVRIKVTPSETRSLVP